MCGINGIVRLRPDAEPVDREELLRTRDAMVNRGPDAAGEWLASDGSAALGHRRLAIIDLSQASNQPLSWADGRYQIVFNGEIYNYRELRTQLEAVGVVFRTRGDTEVILALYEREGIGALRQLRGMFALALWDAHEQRLLLARDPYGIKPLYYSAGARHLRFASQVKALEAGGGVDDEIDPAAIVGFLLWGSVPSPLTLRRAIRAVPAGHFLLAQRGAVSGPKSYYTPGNARRSEPLELAAALRESVAMHLVSDVPVAIFLSAGLDSTLLAALACRHLSEPPTTFTLRFEQFVGTGRDEAPLAAAVARQLGTRHVERTITRADVPDLWPRVIAAMDQPSIDGFNTYLVSRLAREAGLKVVLSGLGGDELFGGYPTFRDVPSWTLWARRGRNIPGLGSLWPALARAARPSQPKLQGFVRYGKTLPGAYYLHRGLFLPEELPGLIDVEIARAGLQAYDPVADAARQFDGNMADAWHVIHTLESSFYMQHQLLRDSDWASMAHSLELRVPLVDAWLREDMISLGFEPARSRGKAAVVQSVASELPSTLWNRPKSGFSVPVMDFLDNPSHADGRRWGRDSRRLALRVLGEFAPPALSATANRSTLQHP